MTDIKKGIVGIRAKPDSIYTFAGTGFIVHGGLIVTCAHVVRQADDRDNVLRFQLEDNRFIKKASLTALDHDLDLAILTPLEPLQDVETLPLLFSNHSQGHKFSAFGYPQKGLFQGLHGAGEIRGLVKDKYGRDALQLASDEVTYGYSGGPVWDDELKAIVGMIGRGLDKDLKLDDKLGAAGFAIPCETLKAFYPALDVAEAPPPPTYEDALAYRRARINRAQDAEILLDSGLFDAPKFADKVLRPTLISRLHNLTKMEPVVAVEGLSGCGKSYVVSSFVETDDAKKIYTSVFWYDPQVDDSLDGFLAQMETTLNLTGLSVIAKCKQLLRILRKENVLLVIDNFDQVDQNSYSTLITQAARDGLPASIILVSREYFDFIHTLPEIGHLEVRGFDLQETQHYLANRGLQGLSLRDMQSLVDKTDGLPLAVSLFATLVLHFGRNPADLLSGTMLGSTRLYEWFTAILSKTEEDEAVLLNFLSLCDIPFNKGIINLAGRHEKLRNTEGVFENLQRKYLIQSYTTYRWNVHRLIAGFCQNQMDFGVKRQRHLAFARYYSRGLIDKHANILDKDEFSGLILGCRHFQRANKHDESERVLKTISKTVKTRGHYEIFIQLSAIEMHNNPKRDSWLDYDYAHCCFITGRLKLSLQVIEPLFYSTPEQDVNKRIAVSRLYAEILGSMNREQLALEKLREVLNNFSPLSAHPTIFNHAKSIEIWLLTRLGTYQVASEMCEGLLADSSRRNDKRGGAVALTRWGIIDQASGRTELAYEKLLEAVQLFRECEDRRGLGWSLSHLALSELSLNYYITGNEHLQESLQISADSGQCSVEYLELLDKMSKIVMNERVLEVIEAERQRVRTSLA